MKKVVFLLLACLIVSVMCGCTPKKPSMYIKPSDFSQETMEVLDLFDDEIQFFDIRLDETIKSYEISIWAYRDGAWYEDGKTYGEVEFLGDRIAVRLTETCCDLYTMDKSGHVKCSYPILDVAFDESGAIGGCRIDRRIPIELNKEIPIWVKIGTKSSSIRVMDITDEFRLTECNAGIAVTMTVSDKVVE